MELQQAGGGRKLEPIEKGTLFARVEIDCANTMQQVIPGGYLVPAGVHVARVKRADVPAIQAMVEPFQSRISELAENADLDLQRSLDEGLLGVEGDEERAARRAEIIALNTSSVAGRFQDRHGRAMLPFASVKVIEDNLLAPVDDDKATADGLLAKQIIAALQGAGGGAATANGVSAEDVLKIVATALDAQAAKNQAAIDAAVAKALDEERATRPANQAPKAK